MRKNTRYVSKDYKHVPIFCKYMFIKNPLGLDKISNNA